MNLKLISWLQRIFWILGWLILGLAVAMIGLDVYYHFKPPSEFLSQYEFYLSKQTQLLCSLLAQAFFAFLISSVFGMVFHKAPVKQQQTEVFLKLTCIGFIGEGVMGLVVWGYSIVGLFTVEAPSVDANIFQTLFHILSVLQIFPNFIPLVYAIAVYVLYRHFSRMVLFESEVV